MRYQPQQNWDSAHNFSETWATDATNHWHVCAGCGLKQDEAAHEPGAEATATTSQTCTICAYEIVPAFGEDETTGPAEVTGATYGPTEEIDGTIFEDQNGSVENGFPVWIVVAFTAVAISAVVVFIIIKRKK